MLYVVALCRVRTICSGSPGDVATRAISTHGIRYTGSAVSCIRVSVMRQRRGVNAGRSGCAARDGEQRRRMGVSTAGLS